MIFTGCIVNAIAVLIFGFVGSFLRRGIPERMSVAISHALGMCVMIIGVRGAIKSVVSSASLNEYIEIIAVVCMVLGVIIGELIDIDKWMNAFGDFLQKKMRGLGNGTRVGEGFVANTTVCCIGAWAITGAMESAMGDHTSLYVKAVVDAITALVLSTSLGWGVALSSISILVYQGAFAVLFFFAGAIIPVAAMEAMGIVGSILIIMIALNFLGITRIRVANFIPAIFLTLFASLIFA